MMIEWPPLHQCPLSWQAARQPEAPALYLDDQTLSYRALEHWVRAVARQLEGFAPGSRIGAVAESSPLLIALMIACRRQGLELLVVSYRLTLEQQRAVLQAVGAVGLYLGREQPRTLSVQLDVMAIDLSEAPLAEVEARPEQTAVLDPEQPMTLLQTSGSSGQAKIVVHAWRAHYWSARGSAAQIPLSVGDRWLLSLPLFHVGGQAIVWRCLLAGAALVLSAQPLAILLRARRLSHLSLVNTQLYRLVCEGVDFAASGLRVLLLGGAAVSPSLLQALAHTDVRVLASYGLTELASQVCTGPAELIDGQLGVGTVLPGRELKLDARGQILLRGQTLMLGYLGADGLDPALDAAGWFASRDLGRWARGQLLICGRVDNLLISGGENIQPEEIEQQLMMHPEVLQAAVVAVPDREYGHRPVAFLRMRNGPANAIKWSLWLADRLARFKIPDYFWDWPVEADPGLKVDRRRLAQLALQYRDSDGAAMPDSRS